MATLCCYVMWSLIWENGFGLFQHLYEENHGVTKHDIQPTPSNLHVCVCFSENTFNWCIAGSGRRLQHGDSADGPHWTCTQCTFQNHPLLDKCETCEMPRLLLGTDTCYCHPTLTKPSPTQPTGSACRETTSSWAVVNCGVINRMMWLTEQTCKYTITLYLVFYWHCVYMYSTNNCTHWLLDAKCIVFVWFAPASWCKVNRHPSPSAGSIPSDMQPSLLGWRIHHICWYGGK